jgi:hypothetical protein
MGVGVMGPKKSLTNGQVLQRTKRARVADSPTTKVMTAKVSLRREHLECAREAITRENDNARGRTTCETALRRHRGNWMTSRIGELSCPTRGAMDQVTCRARQ